MKVKNVNPLERHVEKIILAVAAAASAYLVYASISAPVTVEKGGKLLGVSEIAPQIKNEVEVLKAKGDLNQNRKLDTRVPDFVAGVESQNKSPVDSVLLAALPRIGPVQVQPSASRGDPGTESIRIATPLIPAPKNIKAVAARGQVYDRPANSLPATPDSPPDAGSDSIQDLSWVKVTADYPTSQLLLALAGNNLDSSRRLPESLQRPHFVEVVVERQEQNAEGRWPSDWKPVPQIKWQKLALETVNSNKANLANRGDDPQFVNATLKLIDDSYKDILWPVFYDQPDAAALAAATPEVRNKTAAELEQEARDKDRLEALRRQNTTTPPRTSIRTPPGMVPPPGMGSSGGARSTTPATRTPFVAPPVTPAATPTSANPFPPNIVMPPGMAPPPGFVMPPGMVLPPGMGTGQPNDGSSVEPNAPPEAKSTDELLAQYETAVWFYDETVKPDHKYRYRMAMRIYNPLFHLQLPLADSTKFNAPWLTSGWTTMDLKDAVQINASQNLFVLRGFAEPGAGNVKIYQWERGRYYGIDETVVPGVQVGHKDSQNNVDFKTGYTVVKVTTDARTGETEVVLLAPSGELIIKNSLLDQDDPGRQDIENKMRQTSPK